MRSFHKPQRKRKKSSNVGSVSQVKKVVVGREVLSVFSGFFSNAVKAVTQNESHFNKIVPTDPEFVVDNSFNKNETEKKEKESELNSGYSNNGTHINVQSNLTAMENKYISAEKSNDIEKEKLVSIPNKLENNDYFNWSSVQETKKEEKESELNNGYSNNENHINIETNLTAMENKNISAEKSNNIEKEKLVYIPNKLENNDYFNWTSVQSAWETNPSVKNSYQKQDSELLNYDPGPSGALKQSKRRKQSPKFTTHDNKSSILASKKTVCQPDAKFNLYQLDSKSEKKAIPVNITSLESVFPEVINFLKNVVVPINNPVPKGEYLVKGGESLICDQNLESPPDANRAETDEIPVGERTEDGLGVMNRNTRKRKATTTNGRSSMIDRLRTRKRKPKIKK